ncbi:MAG: prolipoprotein diacylglyceryl transferase, partial [Oscillospiraceae bacterium]|nr:prolipoprotein diacylglyceryl transferase [Oscillospiraceae bacterium]
PKQDDGKFLPASVGPPPLSRGGTTRQSGLVFAMYVAWYGLGRFFIEGLRVDSLMLGNLRISQAIAALSFVVGMWFIYKLTKKEKSK